MRLTVDVISGARCVQTPSGDRMVELRGRKIPYIENLENTNDLFQVIDLVDNDITVVENMPKLDKLKGILFNNNQITRINQQLNEVVPNLEWISFCNNKILLASELVGLKGCKHLSEITLIGNDVITEKNYRIFLIWLCPSLKTVDFVRVSQSERDLAVDLYGERTVAEALKIYKKNQKDIKEQKAEVEEKEEKLEGTEVEVEEKEENLDGTGREVEEVPQVETTGRDEEGKIDKIKLAQRLQTALSLEEIEEIEALLAAASK